MQHKNLNDIIPPSRRRAMSGEMGQPMPTTEVPQVSLPPQMPPRPSVYRPRRSFPVGTALIALAVILASVGALFLFSGAKIAVTPTENEAQVSGTFAALKSSGDIPFEMVTVEKTAMNSIDAESTENVTQAAQGNIIVQNAQEASQPLIKNTRFETSEGLVFRIRDSITVPAAKNGTPGTLSVTVYADEAGDTYNVGATTFTLPGLKGSDTYTKVTARSTDAMKGGFAGPRPTVSQATKDAEFEKLRTTLDAELKTAILEKMPEGYVLLPGATAATYEPQPDTAGAGNTVSLATRGVIRAVVFPEEALARAIAYQSVGTYSGEPLRFKDVNALALAPAEGLIPTEGDSEFSFTLTGAVTLVWKVDPTKIAAAVAGKTRDAAVSIIATLPEIDESKTLLILKPFWVNVFPVDPDKIKVSVAGVEEQEK